MNALEIKKSRLKLKLTQEELGELLGVSKRTIINYENGGVIPPTKAKILERVLRLSLTSEEIKPVLPVEESKIVKNKYINLNSKKGLIPYYDIDFVAGNIDVFDDKGEHVSYYMDIPQYRGCISFNCMNDSMTPKIDKGNILLAKKEEYWQDFIEYGQVYGVVLQNGRRYLKYVCRPEEKEKYNTHFKLQSENTFYEPFELPKDKIKSMWLIMAWINQNA